MTEEIESPGDGLARLSGLQSFAETFPGLRIGIAPAEGDKCPRCWHRDAGVGSDADYPQVCPRCAGSLRTLLAGGA